MSTQTRVEDNFSEWNDASGTFKPQKQAPKSHEDVLVFGLLPAYVAGSILCSLVLLEGGALLMNLFRIPLQVDLSLGPGYHSGSPNSGAVELDPHYPASLGVVLSTIGFGDLLGGLIGFAALASTAPRVFAVLCWWRAVVAVLGVPAVGVLAAVGQQTSASRAAVCLWMVTGIAVALVLAFVACQVFLALLAAAAALNLQVGARAAEARASLDRNVALEPRAFGLVSLDQAVQMYALALVGISVWALVVLVAHGHGTNAWAAVFFTHAGRSTFWLEILLFFTVFGGSLVGISSISGLRESAHDAENLRITLGGHGSFGEDDREEAISIYKSSRWAHQGVLTFFIVNLARISLFIPITGMALAESNVCGFYVHGLSSVAAGRPPWWPGSTPARCSGAELVAGVSMVVLVALDVYLMVCTYWLWWHHRGAWREDRVAVGAAELKTSEARYGTVGEGPKQAVQLL